MTSDINLLKKADEVIKLEHEKFQITSALETFGANSGSNTEQNGTEEQSDISFLLESGIPEASIIVQTPTPDSDLTSDPELSKAVKVMKDFRVANEKKALASDFHLDAAISWCDKQINLLAERSGRLHTPPSLREQAFIRQMGLAINRAKEEKMLLPHSNPDAFYAIHGKILQGYAEQLRSGKLVLVPYVQKNLEILLQNMRDSVHTFIHGETGSGKTELAKLAARIFTDKECVLVRGYPGMGSEELFGHMTLKSTAKDLDTLPDRINAAIDKWKERNPEANKSSLNAAIKQIVAGAANESGVPVTEYILKGIYQAAKERRIAVIDEANYIPQGLRAKLNEPMSLRPGDPLNTQENGYEPLEVQPGGMIFTGNMDYSSASKKYGDRFSLGVAFANRIRILEHDFLPQETQGHWSQVIDPQRKQLFTIALATVLLDDGSAVLPEDGLDKLWNLCVYAKHTQNAFCGKIKQGDPMSFYRGGVSNEIVPEVCISPRVLERIIESWRTGSQDIDSHLFSDFICSATKFSDRAYLYDLAKKCGFFQGDEWLDPSYSERGEITDFPVKNVETIKKPLIHLSSQQCIEAIYGRAPERTIWPEGKEDQKLDQNYSARVFAIGSKIHDVSGDDF